MKTHSYVKVTIHQYHDADIWIGVMQTTVDHFMKHSDLYRKCCEEAMNSSPEDLPFASWLPLNCFACLTLNFILTLPAGRKILSLCIVLCKFWSLIFVCWSVVVMCWIYYSQNWQNMYSNRNPILYCTVIYCMWWFIVIVFSLLYLQSHDFHEHMLEHSVYPKHSIRFVYVYCGCSGYWNSCFYFSLVKEPCHLYNYLPFLEDCKVL